MKLSQRPLLPLAYLALVFNALLLLSVTLDLEWAHSRAAGGQFEAFPWVIRVVYLLMAIAMIFLMRFLWRLNQGDLEEKQRRAGKWVGFLFILSTATQLISQSTDERWNAIPALIIALAFLRAGKSGEVN